MTQYFILMKFLKPAFKKVCSLRDKLAALADKRRKPSAELEFFPAALEVTETPPAPLGRIILWTIVLFFLAAVIWAVVGKVDIVAVAQGKIVPSGRVKIIQPLEAGVVKKILVEGGQQVEQGQPLIELDSTMTGADRVRLYEESLSLQLDYVRLEALLNFVKNSENGSRNSEAGECGSASGLCVLTPEFLSTLPLEVTEQQRSILQQRTQSQWREFVSRTEALKNQIQEHQSDLQAVKEKIEQLDATIPLITERATAMESMLESGAVSRARWLEVEERRIGQVKERDIQRNNLDKLKAAVSRSQQELAALRAQVSSQWLGELNKTENRRNAIEQELIKAENRQTLQTLKAPVAGTVEQMTVHTIGGVVKPAQELMRIVPDGGAMEVEAWVQNKDIGFVNEGQAVEIKVQTFPFTKYGVIDGEILNISDDAVQNEDLGLVYTAQVSMDKSTMQVNGKTVNLSPGMAVTAEVKIGKRRIIEYLLSPLLRYKEESIKER